MMHHMDLLTFIKVQRDVSPLYTCFSVKDINKEYLYHYFKGTLWYKYIYMHGDSGARHDRVILHS